MALTDPPSLVVLVQVLEEGRHLEPKWTNTNTIFLRKGDLFIYQLAKLEQNHPIFINFSYIFGKNLEKSTHSYTKFGILLGSIMNQKADFAAPVGSMFP